MADMYAQIIGDKQLLANLNALAPKVKKRIMKPAMRKGASVVAKRAKTKVKKRSGLLKKAIKAKSTKNGNGRVFVDTKVVGEYKGKKVWPAKYAHLVEFGTAFRAKGTPSKSGKLLTRDHAATPAKPFLRPALNEGKDDAFKAVTAEAQKQFGKLASQGKTILK